MLAGGIQREQVSYRIGPLTIYAEALELEAWLKQAQPGDETWYAIGPALSPGAVAANLARKYHAAGLATLHLNRAEGQLHYMIRKCAPAPVPAAPKISSLYPSGPVRELYDVICAIAAEGQPLPSNDALAEQAMLSDRHAVRYRLNLLIGAGFLRLMEIDGQRVAELPDKGMRTAAFVGGRP